MRYVFCVLRPLCSKREKECEKHRHVRCNEDDCAHLLPVQPGEELICSEDFVTVPGLGVSSNIFCGGFTLLFFMLSLFGAVCVFRLVFNVAIKSVVVSSLPTLF